MASPIIQNKSYTSESEQKILKKSRDDKYDVLAVMLLGEDGDTARRVKVDSSGSISVGNTLPTEGQNPSLILNYTDNVLTSIIKIIGDKSYRKVLSYTDGNLTGVSGWSEV